MLQKLCYLLRYDPSLSANITMNTRIRVCIYNIVYMHCIVDFFSLLSHPKTSKGVPQKGLSLKLALGIFKSKGYFRYLDIY